MSERKIREWVFPFLKSKRTYIDIGAYIGETSLPFLDEFDTVIAFEPNPNSFNILKENKKIQTYNIALGKEEHKTNLIVPTGQPASDGSIAIRRNLNWIGDIFEVEVKRLDDFNFTDVDFIKIDVEEGEQEVIMGSLETIKKYEPVIMFENKRNENDIIILWLQSLGYTLIKHKSDTVAFKENNNENFNTQ